ncbi:Uncharacterised protein [Serratia plymuthica]|uniref:Uncharacterized protein n=1 Tax=Serratia plymuthica TaxID=82996 RepID=A0A2X4VD57_SERPL|nr:Uncharacterised protein [Serratia plymuthica]
MLIFYLSTTLYMVFDDFFVKAAVGLDLGRKIYFEGIPVGENLSQGEGEVQSGY